MIVLYSGIACPFSHRCRIVLFEKGMDFQINDVDIGHMPEDIAVMNPYNTLPVMVERELTLYESNIINEYIDDRFPHPQLMPNDPMVCGRVRLMLFNFERELFHHIHTLEDGTLGKREQDKARHAVRDALIQIAPLFIKNKYMIGDDYSMLDVAIAPLLWRLEHYGIDTSSKGIAPVLKYAERLFDRPAFFEAMTPNEKAMRA